MSTRQRIFAIELDFPPSDIELVVVINESGVAPDVAEDLVNLGQAIRRLEDSGLREFASTRALIAAGKLISHGLPAVDAGIAAICPAADG